MLEMINPESIDLTALPSVALCDRTTLPPVPAIYFALDSLGNMQYVGRSVNLQQRWTRHHRQCYLENMDGVRIAWLTVNAPELLPEIEAALIEWFNPPLNGY